MEHFSNFATEFLRFKSFPIGICFFLIYEGISFFYICQDISFDLNGFKINCEDNVKLLGSSVDFELKFDKRHSDICKKTSRKILIQLHLKALVHEQIKLSDHLLQLYF
jgi:hypothetical protein